MTVTIVAAVALNGVIGKDGKLPWHFPEDMKHFRSLTTGHYVIMGRKTWDSLGRRPLPKRTNVVVTSTPEAIATRNVDVLAGKSLEDVIRFFKDSPKDIELFIIGGASIYKEALPIADRMVITHINGEYEGDVLFPEVNASEWREINEEYIRFRDGDLPGDRLSVVTYEKIR